MIVLGVLSVRCGWQLVDGPPAWLPFVQANALYVAAALLNRVGDDDPGPVRWRTWVVEGGAWGVTRVANLAARRFAAARAGEPTAS